MKACCPKRQEKHQQHLRPDGFFHLSLAKANVLHNDKTFPVIVAFRYLFIINDEYGCQKKDHTKEKADKENRSILLKEIFFFLRPVLERGNIGPLRRFLCFPGTAELLQKLFCRFLLTGNIKVPVPAQEVHCTRTFSLLKTIICFKILPETFRQLFHFLYSRKEHLHPFFYSAVPAGNGSFHRLLQPFSLYGIVPEKQCFSRYQSLFRLIEGCHVIRNLCFLPGIRFIILPEQVLDIHQVFVIVRICQVAHFCLITIFSLSVYHIASGIRHHIFHSGAILLHLCLHKLLHI